MTLLWIDGFEGQDFASIYEYNTGASTNTNTRFAYGRCIVLSNRAFGKDITGSTEVIAGFAWNVGTNGWAGQMVEFVGDGQTTTHLRIQTSSSGTIQIMRGTSTLLAESTVVVTQGVWHHVEFRARIDDTTGFAEVRLNGVSAVTFSGDTRNGGTSAAITHFRIYGQAGATVDDLYILNTLGTSNNTWLGDRRVITLSPTGAGSTTGLTATPAVANWQNVDELPPVATDYNSSSVVGTRDTYAMADLPFTPTQISGIRASLWAHKTDAGALSIKPALKIGATVYYPGTYSLPSSIGPLDSILGTSPATSAAWTASEINAIEFGGEVAT